MKRVAQGVLPQYYNMVVSSADRSIWRTEENLSSADDEAVSAGILRKRINALISDAEGHPSLLFAYQGAVSSLPSCGHLTA